MKKRRMEELLTITEVSKLLKIHPNTLRAWDEKGILKAVRFGVRGDRRYRREDIEKFIDSKTRV
ncbi:MAG: DNA-binding protein, excisionase family [Microgenomates group bacterium GW2011_GWC1_44_37]|nr:MAG: DNA-binding protein, excisionase family [Candidatus Collierbacteria bacterium GW2011_GWB1_44_197]KKT61476.1 MAG: DNA-binding protein, excisionase family [Candidatus Collierbacteria bacterium GW2011_GWD1_44_27]KKT65633.1 MAG: DNA-binding protein, excisionase family [Candidatus Collierbacteria bacterium GW2011_GWC2_44_30]KKT68548.1 MAG: DNA-binding protein, excisionase family [Microgenomates group bacterium GW2011_GWC1_44_37]